MSFVTIVTADEKLTYKIGDTTFHVRRVPAGVTRDAMRRHTRKRRDRGQQIDEIDYIAVAEDILDYAVLGWENVRHPITGEDVPCSRETKLALPDSVQGEILAFVQEGESGQTDHEAQVEKN